MTERISPRQFHEAEGVIEWRMLANMVAAHFRTGNFATGVAFVDLIGKLADEANHHPDVDLRYSGVTVRLMTHEVDGLSQRDIDLARQISAAAWTLGVAADPSGVQDVRISIDALDVSAVRPFWKAVLGYREMGDEDLLDPHSRGPLIRFQQIDQPREGRSRVHVDVFVPHDEVLERIEASLAAGGRLVTEEHAPAWWVLADVEGNESCIATWRGRD
ncbi:MAG TPA: 4a-hydroxytetrahydrobiopterin dehydratase [Acidimicrobiales bacterium]|nr:4a-hydroxytetrahydrobiopterin dehydratase [Acidimicrobiales bacterium]